MPQIYTSSISNEESMSNPRQQGEISTIKIFPLQKLPKLTKSSLLQESLQTHTKLTNEIPQEQNSQNK